MKKGGRNASALYTHKLSKGFVCMIARLDLLSFPIQKVWIAWSQLGPFHDDPLAKHLLLFYLDRLIPKKEYLAKSLNYLHVVESHRNFSHVCS